MKKFVSIILILATVLPCAAGCSDATDAPENTQGQEPAAATSAAATEEASSDPDPVNEIPEEILSDDLWYTAAKVSVEPFEGSLSTGINLVYADDGTVAYTRGDSWSVADENGESRQLFDLTFCDYSGQVTSRVDLSEAIEAADAYSYQLFCIGGEPYIINEVYPVGMLNINPVLYKIDVSDGSMTKTEAPDFKEVYSQYGNISLNRIELQTVASVPYLFAYKYTDAETGTRTLSALYEIKEDLSLEEKNIDALTDTFEDGCYCISAGDSILVYTEYWGAMPVEISYAVYNPEDETCKILPDTSPLYERNPDVNYTDVSYTEDGIVYVYDAENDRFKAVFGMNNANVNRYDITDSPLQYYSDDRLVFSDPAMQISSDSTFDLCLLTRADENPNAGKTVFTAATVSGSELFYSAAEAVRKFNDRSDTAYIFVDYRYGTEPYDGDCSDEEYAVYTLNSEAEIDDILIRDIRDGTAPDIVFDAGDRLSMHTDELFLNLSDYAEDIDKDLYFDFVFAPEEVYHVPVSVRINGTLSRKDLTGDTAAGFTYDEYEKWVAEDLNGWNPMATLGDRMEVFIVLFNEMSATFIHDGDIDIDNDAFRALADYCLNLPEDSSDVSYPEGTDYYNEYGAGLFAAMQSASTNSISYAALPTYEGTPPSVLADETCGIPVSSQHRDDAWEFVKFFLSEDCQHDPEFCPVLKSAYDTYAEAMLAEYNSMKTESEFTYEEGWDKMIDITDELTNSYFAVVESAPYYVKTDAATELILREEMPAYFAGQKSIDDVISVISDRAQTVYDERS